MSLAPLAHLLFQQVLRHDPTDDQWLGRGLAGRWYGLRGHRYDPPGNRYVLSGRSYTLPGCQSIVNGGVYFNGASVSVPRGTTIQAAGNGIIPSTRILFEFRTPIGTVAYSYLNRNASRSNCVVHQEGENINTSVLAPGTYHVYASLWASNRGELPGYPFGWPYCRTGDFVAYLTVF